MPSLGVDGSLLAVTHGVNGRFKLTSQLDRLVRVSLLRVREGEAHD